MRIDNKDWLPPTLLKLWKRKPGENAAIANFLIDLERIAYFLFVSRYGVNDRIARYVSIMNEIDPQGTKHAEGLVLSDIEQAEFIEELDGDIYRKTRVCKPVLQRLDEALSTGGASYDELVSIEHVLPQTVEKDSEWENLFPDETQRNEWTHRLANLVFLTQRVNIRASNWSFERKKSEYFSSKDGSSPFVITQGVLQTDEWTLDHLIARQDRLLRKLAQIWKLDLSKVQNQDTLEIHLPKEESDSSETRLIEAKRQSIMQALATREGVAFIKKGGAFLSSTDDTVRVVCTLSKRYATGATYWFGYRQRWDEFLSGGKKSLFVLGCMDRNIAYAIPHERINKLLRHLHKSAEGHWHIYLEESKTGQIEWTISKTGSRIGLGEFQINLPVDI